MARFRDDLTVEEALAEHYRLAGLGPDGGYSSRWVRFKIGPLPLAFPNIDARRIASRFHDVNHVLTEYRTDWTGEMEIGAWEIATGCGLYWAAWYLNLGVFGVGTLLRPKRTFRAWCRGRRSATSLYRGELEPVLAATLGTLRARLRLDHDTSSPTLADRMSYALWAGVGLGLVVLQVAVPVAAVWLAIAWLA